MTPSLTKLLVSGEIIVLAWPVGAWKIETPYAVLDWGCDWPGYDKHPVRFCQTVEEFEQAVLKVLGKYSVAKVFIRPDDKGETQC